MIHANIANNSTSTVMDETMKTVDNKKYYDTVEVVEMEEENVGRKAAWGTLLSCCVRVFSFMLSQLTLRMLDPQILGRASIEFELLLNTSLFIGREGFRLALTKQTKTEGEEEECARVCWMSIPSGIGLSLLCLSYHLYFSRNEVDDYKYAGMMYCFAAAVEAFSEPHVIYAMRRMDVSSRAKAQAIAIFVKSIATIVFLYHPTVSQKFPMTALGVAQMLYGLTLTLCQIQFMKPPPYSKVFTSNTTSTGVYKKLVLSFSAQSLFKHLLTQGDRIVLTALRQKNPTAMGSYAMAKNYGGIVSRFLFLPLEENTRLLFSACINKSQCNHENAQNSDRNQTNANHAYVYELRNAYVVILKFVIYIGFVFASIGSNYTYVLIHTLLGSIWSSKSSAVSSLSTFCKYTAILAMNGITEAFIYGTINSGKSIRQLMVVHGIVGVFFYTVLAPPLLQRYEATGIILANAIAMSMRVSFSLYFATNYFATTYTNNSKGASYTRDMIQQFKFIIHNALPHPIILMLFISSYVITKHSSLLFHQKIQQKLQNDNLLPLSSYLLSAVPHILVGITCLSLIAIAMYSLEKPFRNSLRILIQKRQKEKQQ